MSSASFHVSERSPGVTGPGFGHQEGSRYADLPQTNAPVSLVMLGSYLVCNLQPTTSWHCVLNTWLQASWPQHPRPSILAPASQTQHPGPSVSDTTSWPGIPAPASWTPHPGPRMVDLCPYFLIPASLSQHPSPTALSQHPGPSTLE